MDPSDLVAAIRARARLLDRAGNLRAGEEIELGARVSDWAESTESGWLWRTATDAQGEFGFEDLPAGRFYVRWVRKEAGLVARDLETRVWLAPGTVNELELAPEGWATSVITLPASGLGEVKLGVVDPR